MRQLLILFILISFSGIAYSQLYSLDSKIDNVKQIDETSIQWEVWIKKSVGSDDFAYYGGQFTFQFDNDVLNGGKFVPDYFDIEGGENMNQYSGFYDDVDAWVTGNPPNQFFNWASTAPPNVGQSQTVISDTWIKFATFKAQLRKGAGNGVPHNFKDMDPKLAFSTVYSNIASRDMVTSPTYSGVNTPITNYTFTPNRGVPANTRQLAGYWFSGEGNWVEATRWNNVTTENINIVPPLVTNNAIISGSCTLTDTRTINQLVVAEGGYLVLNEAAELTTTDLYNDNQSAEKTRAETIAAWDFEDTGQTGLPYLADDGIASNIGIASINTNAAFVAFTDAIPGGNRSLMGQNFYATSGFPPQPDPKDWRLQLSSEGFQNLKLSSVQWSDNGSFATFGPTEFKIQWSSNGVNWNDISNGTITVGENWSTGVTNNLALPNDLNNISDFYIRWLNSSGNKMGYTAIDNIIITGEEIPPPPTGILIESTAAGTGSLIHNNDNLEATIQRYIPATNGNPVYHLVSVPLTQASNPLSGLFEWSYLFNFDVATQEWVAMGTSLYNPLYVNQGYMIYKYPGSEKWETDTTYSFAGPINNGYFECNVDYSPILNSHNLVPNPYPSAIDWDAANGWTKTNVYNAIWIWNPTAKNYAAYGSNAGTNGATKYIPVGQSFFVSASAAAPALMMNNDVRVHDNQAFLKNENEIVELLRIHSSANSFSDEAIIRFSDGATAAFDGQFDVTKFYGNADAPQLFSMSSDSKELSINSLEVGAGKRFVDLGFKLEATGMCTFIFSGIESFNPDMQIHLTDRVTGQTIDLRANPEYTFAHSPENDPMRFELTFNGVTSIDEVKAVNQDFFYVDGRLYLNFPQESRGPFNVTVYNINGQIEFMGVAHEAGAVVDLTSLTSGFHIVRVVTSDYSGEKKIVVK